MEYELIKERKEVLRGIHAQIIKANSCVGPISRKGIIELIQEQPAPRFYISPYTAQLYINDIQHRRTNSKRPDMMQDLLENYNRLKAENPNQTKEWLYEHVVEQPAKSFYLTAMRIEEIIFGYRTRKKKAAVKTEQANQ